MFVELHGSDVKRCNACAGEKRPSSYCATWASAPPAPRAWIQPTGPDPTSRIAVSGLTNRVGRTPRSARTKAVPYRDGRMRKRLRAPILWAPTRIVPAVGAVEVREQRPVSASALTSTGRPPETSPDERARSRGATRIGPGEPSREPCPLGAEAALSLRLPAAAGAHGLEVLRHDLVEELRHRPALGAGDLLEARLQGARDAPSVDLSLPSHALHGSAWLPARRGPLPAWRSADSIEGGEGRALRVAMGVVGHALGAERVRGEGEAEEARRVSPPACRADP